MSEQRTFPKGINAFKPHPAAPSFIISNLKIRKQEFIDWLEDQEGDEVRLDVLISKEGDKQNIQVNNYKKS